jgi:hypothetical protein
MCSLASQPFAMLPLAEIIADLSANLSFILMAKASVEALVVQDLLDLHEGSYKEKSEGIFSNILTGFGSSAQKHSSKCTEKHGNGPVSGAYLHDSGEIRG